MAYIKHLISNKLFLLLLISLGFGLGIFKSCQSPQNDKNTKTESEELLDNKDAIADLDYKMEVIQLPEGLEILPEDQMDTTYYRVEYAVFKDHTLTKWQEAIMLFNDTASSFKEDAELFLESHRKTEELREGGPFAWVVNQKMKVLHNLSNYVGFSFDSYSYLGGAHGNYFTKYLHWDRINQVEISGRYFFNEELNNDLTKLGEKFFRKHFKLKETESLEEGFFFENGVFSLPDNFKIDEKGNFCFLYNIYEILPYVSGTTEILIPSAEIRPFLSEKGLEILDSVLN